jgi:hypothetical protein
MTPLRGPTCRAPRYGAPTCSASGATRAIKTGRSLKTTIAIRRPRQIARGPSRSGAVAAFSGAAMRIRTTTKGSRPIRPRVASAICFCFLESTARRGPVRCARLRADGAAGEGPHPVPPHPARASLACCTLHLLLGRRGCVSSAPRRRCAIGHARMAEAVGEASDRVIAAEQTIRRRWVADRPAALMRVDVDQRARMR